MVKIELRNPNVINFQPFGRYVSLPSLEEFADELQGWRCWITEDCIIERSAYVGFGLASDYVPCSINSVQRLVRSTRLIACSEGSLVVTVAANKAPSLSLADLYAFVLHPGEVIVLREGTWFGPCLGLDGPTHYLFVSSEQENSTEYFEFENDRPFIVEP